MRSTDTPNGPLDDESVDDSHLDDSHLDDSHLDDVSLDGTRRDAAAPSPATAWALIAVAALGLLAVPAWRQVESGHGEVLAAWRTAWQPTGGSGEQGGEPGLEDAGEDLWAWNRHLLGRLEAVEAALEDGSPLRAAALPRTQWALLRFGGVGNETVYVAGARPTWLTLRSGFDHTTGPAFLDPDVLERRRRAGAGDPDPRPALLDLQSQLAARDIELVLMPVPSKPAVVPAALDASDVATGDPARNPSLPPLLDTLRGAGVEVFDPAPLLAELGDAAYLRTDSHWSPAAIDRVAAALAAELEGLDPDSSDLGPRDRDWLRTPLERTGRGDLWRALSLPDDRPVLAEESVEIQQVTSWDGLLWQATRGAPVLLLGDSFSTVYSDENLHWGSGAGFAEQLAYHLGRDVDRIARPDGASDQVRRELARQGERLDGVKVVVYQVATREFSVGEWPVLSLSPE